MSYFKQTAALSLILIVAGCGAERSPFVPGPGSGGAQDFGSGGAVVIGDDAGSGGVEMDAPILTGTGGARGGGSGGAPVVVDSGVKEASPPVDKPAPADTAIETAQPAPFTCNYLLGLHVAGQWWPTFEAMMDGSRWQYVSIPQAYVDSWGNPDSMAWQTAVMSPQSPCATRSANPDRVLLIAFSPTLGNALFQFNTALAIAAIRTKFPGVKRIEFLTTLRSPNNAPCPGRDVNTSVPSYVDTGLAAVAGGQKGGDVVVGPKIEVANCNWFDATTTDLQGSSPMSVGELYARYYKDHL